MNNLKTVGIVGGGQLGQMLTVAATKLGFNVLVLDPTPNCPAKQAGAEQILGSWKDKELIKELLEKSDFLTIEIEHIDTGAFADLNTDTPINPAPQTIKLIQNKYEQKLFLKNNDIEVGEFLDLENWDNLKVQLGCWGGSLYLKSKFDAYDGRGNWFIEDEANLDQNIKNEDPKNFYLEKKVDFIAELSVIVVKDLSGNIKSYPTTKTVHKRSICIETQTPCGFSDGVSKNAQDLAEKAVAKLSGAGTFGVEMFLDSSNNLLINEIAPRVHNSGHWTMNGSDTSQFENHIRAITGMELGSTKMKVPACSMVNILGEIDNAVIPDTFPKINNVEIYWYGKSPVKLDRKMGHINAIGDTIEETLADARNARSLIKI